MILICLLTALHVIFLEVCAAKHPRVVSLVLSTDQLFGSGSPSHHVISYHEPLVVVAPPEMHGLQSNPSTSDTANDDDAENGPYAMPPRTGKKAPVHSKHRRRPAHDLEDWEKEFPIADPNEAHMTSRATIRVGQTLVVHLPVKAASDREYVWKLNTTYDESTMIVNREQLRALGFPASASLQFIVSSSGYVAPKDGDHRAHQQFVFRGMEPGIIKMAFLYNRPWLYDMQPGGAVSYIVARVVPKRTVRNLPSTTPVTRSSLRLIKGQQVDIKLGNSPSMQYNLWKLMEIFDATTGHIIPGPNQPALLEYVFRESGYVQPSEEDSRKHPHKNPAGHQKFVIFARGIGHQTLKFSFVKPWLPDEQFDRTDALIDFTIVDEDTQTENDDRIPGEAVPQESQENK